MPSNDTSYLQGPSIKFSSANETLADLIIKLLNESEKDDRICAKLKEKELKFSELSALSKQLSMRIPLSKGIVVCMESSFELIIVLCSIVTRGIIYIPVEPKYPLERIEYILTDSHPDLIITDQLSLFEKITNIKTVNYSQLLLSKIDETGGTSKEDSFCLMYTSGSTGKMKGVYLSNQSLLNRLNWQWSTFPYDENEVCCFKTSISFVDSICEIFGPLLYKIRIIIIEKSILIEMDKLVSILFEEKITRFICVPTLFDILINYLINKKIKLINLKLIICSGETLSVNLLNLYLNSKELFDQNCCLLNLYGSTEVMADVTCQIYEKEIYSYDNRVTIGLPIDNICINIIEEDQYGIGELVVRGIGVANGYHNVNEDLSKKFSIDQYGIKCFNTGDLAKIVNNRIYLYGRKDKQV